MSTTDRTYTVGELEDLISGKDVTLINEQRARAALASAPDASWDGQFAGVQSAYASARAKAERGIDVARVGGALIPFYTYTSADGTPEYQGILAAFNPSWASNTSAPGSFDDLDARLIQAAAAQNTPLPTPAPLPQPNMQNDSGENPTGFDAYLTGAAYKLGLVKNPPPGTPGTGGPNGPPLIPSWLKWVGGGALGLWTVSKLADISKALK